MASVCVGIGLSDWFALSLAVAATVTFAAFGAVLCLDGPARLGAVAAALAVLGLAWGSLRMGALDASVLAETDRRDRPGDAGDGRAGSSFALVDARDRRDHARSGTSRYASASCSSCLWDARRPRGAVLDAAVDIQEPRPEQDGFDERAWLARQGIHVVLKASSWRQVGRRGGIQGFGDRLRDRVERADRTRRERRAAGDRARRRPRRGRGPSGGRAARLPRVGALPLARRLGAERRVPRCRCLLPRLAVSPLADRARAVDSRSDRGIRARSRLAAVRGEGGGRRRSRVARVARLATARPLVLPRVRRARPPALDADLVPRSGVPALLRRGCRDLRRSAAPAVSARRLPGAAASRGRSGRRRGVRSRHRADPALPLRPGAAVHRSRESARGAVDAARSRPRSAGQRRRSDFSVRRSIARVARRLGGGVARARRARLRRPPFSADRDTPRARPRCWHRSCVVRGTAGAQAPGDTDAPWSRGARRVRSRVARGCVDRRAATRSGGVDCSGRLPRDLPRRRSGRLHPPRDADCARARGRRAA